MPFVKPSKKTTEKLRGWLILNPNKPRRKPEGPTLEQLQRAEAERNEKPDAAPYKPRKKLDERRAPIPEKKNPESAATGETP